MKNFNIGIINLLVSEKLQESYFNKKNIQESKEISNELLGIVKDSPILQLEFKVFNNLAGKYIENELLAKDYIDKHINLFEIYTIEEIDAERSKLKKFVNEADIPKDNNTVKLYEAIDVLINETLEDYSVTDIDKMHEAFVLVLKHIQTPKTTLLENVDVEPLNEEVIEIAVGKFNEKYVSLDEGDRDLLKKLIKSDSDQKKTLLEEFKTESLSILNKINSEDTKDMAIKSFEKAIQKINEMVYDEKNVDDNIIELYELKKELT